MVQVDLAHMQNVPMDITKPLLAGKCFGTTSMHSCHNGKGVTYFPLPQ
jgi:hypothetical protein